MDIDSSHLQGFVLLATPTLTEGFFARTVVLVALHDAADGAFGYVLNRPTGRIVKDFWPSAKELTAQSPVLIGGPVEADDLSFMGVAYEPTEPSVTLVTHPTAQEAHEFLHTHAETALIWAFQGYCGWGKDQLEEEIENGDWLIVPLTPFFLQRHKSDVLYREAIVQFFPEFAEFLKE